MTHTHTQTRWHTHTHARTRTHTTHTHKHVCACAHTERERERERERESTITAQQMTIKDEGKMMFHYRNRIEYQYKLISRIILYLRIFMASSLSGRKNSKFL